MSPSRCHSEGIGAACELAAAIAATRLSSDRRLASKASTERWASSLRVLAVADGADGAEARKPTSATAATAAEAGTTACCTRAAAAVAVTAAVAADGGGGAELRATELVVAIESTEGERQRLPAPGVVLTPYTASVSRQLHGKAAARAVPTNTLASMVGAANAVAEAIVSLQPLGALPQKLSGTTFADRACGVLGALLASVVAVDLPMRLDSKPPELDEAGECLQRSP